MGDSNLVTDQTYSQSVISFDGQDDYIDFGRKDIGGVFAQGSSAFTISGWINPLQLTDKATTYGTHNVFFARASDRYSDNFEFGINESGNLDIYIDEKIDNALKTFGNGELTVGQWHFFAIAFNKGQLTIYLDEQEYTGSLAGDSLNKATSAVTLGGTLHNNIFFTGQLADIGVWNYALPQAEIQKHRSGSLVGNETGLVAYWPLNEGQGTTVKDQTGNAYDGNLRGDPSWNIVQLPSRTAKSVKENESTKNLPDEPLAASRTAKSVKENEPTKNLPDESLAVVVTSEPDSEVPVGDRISQTEVIEEPSNKTKEPRKQAEKSKIVPVVVQQKEVQISTQKESKKTVNTTPNPKYKILSIDGGGIRGIIPALILAEIEKRTKQPIFSLFDLIAGTSSGGILALGLTKPRLGPEILDNSPTAQYSAEQLVEIFAEYGGDIFYEPFFEKLLGSLEDIFVQPKYSSKGREEVLKQYFGDTPLTKTLKEVFVTSYDLEQRIPIFFTNKLEKQQTESKKFRKLSLGFSIADAALATSATPTYFAPYRVPTTHNPKGFYTLVDGGVIANNPAYLAILEAKISAQAKEEVLHRDDILLVSLGTGSLTSVYNYNDVKNWGLLQWTQPLLNIVLDGGSEVVAGELERLFEPGNKGSKGSYYRFQTFLNSELEEIDNAKPENIRQLKASAARLIAAKSQEIDELAAILLA
uniref:Patatin-like protein n=1 Tax=Kaarinaea lacus PCC 9237 TaxID=3158555 RepID=U5TVU7_9CYAN|nr:patatin-like protein [Nostoc sp. 152]